MLEPHAQRSKRRGHEREFTDEDLGGEMPLKRFLVTVEGPNLKDVSEIELPALPEEGATIETRFGTCIVIRAEESPTSSEYNGKIVCRLP
jgi:hypothetical protein